MSTTAAATAAIASAPAAADRAERAECKLAMRGFENDGATLQARQHYAQCVQLVHPVQYNPKPQDNTTGVAFAAVLVTTIGFLLLIMVATILDGRPRKVK